MPSDERLKASSADLTREIKASGPDKKPLDSLL